MLPLSSPTGMQQAANPPLKKQDEGPFNISKKALPASKGAEKTVELRKTPPPQSDGTQECHLGRREKGCRQLRCPSPCSNRKSLVVV